MPGGVVTDEWGCRYAKGTELSITKLSKQLWKVEIENEELDQWVEFLVSEEDFARVEALAVDEAMKRSPLEQTVREPQPLGEDLRIDDALLPKLRLRTIGIESTASIALVFAALMCTAAGIAYATELSGLEDRWQHIGLVAGLVACIFSPPIWLLQRSQKRREQLLLKGLCARKAPLLYDAKEGAFWVREPAAVGAADFGLLRLDESSGTLLLESAARRVKLPAACIMGMRTTRRCEGTPPCIGRGWTGNRASLASARVAPWSRG